MAGSTLESVACSRRRRERPGSPAALFLVFLLRWLSQRVSADVLGARGSRPVLVISHSLQLDSINIYWESKIITYLCTEGQVPEILKEIESMSSPHWGTGGRKHSPHHPPGVPRGGPSAMGSAIAVPQWVVGGGLGKHENP